MDLRHCQLTAQHRGVAAQILNYQPFIISDDIQTGAAYSQLYHRDPRVAAPLVFYKSEWQDKWDTVTRATGWQRAMYDDFLRAIAERYPGGTLLDVACNNGYFPVRAEMFGMGPSVGMDTGGQYAASMGFLNIVCGTHASFIHATYDPTTHSAPIKGRFDVVMASAIMCHLPDPTYFLAFLGSLAKEAVFLWEQQIDSDDLIVSYSPPHESLVHPDTPGTASFPHSFNDCTMISRGLYETAMKSMGFKNIHYLHWKPEWGPPPGVTTPAEPSPHIPQPARDAIRLVDQLRGRQRPHVAVLATR